MISRLNLHYDTPDMISKNLEWEGTKGQRPIDAVGQNQSVSRISKKKNQIAPKCFSSKINSKNHVKG